MIASAADDDGVQELTSEDLSRYPATVPITPQKNQRLLPLSVLDSRAFEYLCSEVVARRGEGEVHFYGRPGQKQYGLDIVEFHPDGSRTVHQVKRFQTLTTAELSLAVEEYAKSRRFGARKFVLVTSAPVDDETELIDELGRLKEQYLGRFDVGLVGAEALSGELLREATLVNAMFGEAMAQEFCGDPGHPPGRLLYTIEAKKPLEQVLAAALSKAYDDDNKIRFEQIDLIGPMVDNLFVDVPVSADAQTRAAAALRRVNPGGDSENDVVVAGGAQTLLHPSWRHSVVIVGGPGQGKSTLLQYVCQYLRARHLHHDEYTGAQQDLTEVTQLPRIPFRIDLRRYAQWRRERVADLTKKDTRKSGRGRERDRERSMGYSSPKGSARPDLPQAGASLPPEVRAKVSLQSYLVQRITEDSGAAGAFKQKDLLTVIARWPILLACDGLDEVAPVAERAVIATEIREARSQLSEAGRNVIVVVTTRPGLVAEPLWRDPGFAAVELGRLTPALRMSYLHKWAAQAQLEPERVAFLSANYEQNQDKPHVAELSGNPMQLTILLHLLQRGGAIPEKRTELYSDYIRIFFDREATKSQLLRENRELVTGIHGRLGWVLHTQAEQGQTNGALPLEELRTVLHAYLDTLDQPRTLADELFDDLTTRVVCLVMRDTTNHAFEFEVQSLREYFAARHVIELAPIHGKGTRDLCLAAMIQRPFWSNVMRFAAGMFSAGEVRSIPDVCDQVRPERDFALTTHIRSAVKQFFEDQVFSTAPPVTLEKAVAHILSGTGVVLAGQGLLGELRFTPNSGAAALVAAVKERLRTEQDLPTRSAAARVLLQQVGEVDDEIDAVRRWWWSQIPSRSADPTGLTPEQWLITAADLAAFTVLTPERASQLDAVIARLPALTAAGAVEARGVSVVELLVRGGCRTPGTNLTQRCLEELTAGVVDAEAFREYQYDRAFEEFPLHQLVQSCAAERFHDALGHLGRPMVSGAASTGRRRARGQTSELRRVASATQRALAVFTAQGTPAAWGTALEVVEQTWHDSRPLRMAVQATPVAVLREVLERHSTTEPTGSSPSIAFGATWRQQASWRVEADQHRGDPAWWTLQVADVAPTADWRSQLVTTTYLAAVPEFAYSGVLEALAILLDELTGALTSAQWGMLVAAVVRNAKTPAGHVVRVPSLRSGLTLSPRAAVLLLPAADEATSRELRRLLRHTEPQLWGASSAADWVLVRSLVGDDKAKSADLYGARRSALLEGWLGLACLRNLTLTSARDILRRPGDWPTEAVRAAAFRLDGETSKKLAPLAIQAAKDEWQV